MSEKQNSGTATLLKKEPSRQMVQRPVLGRVEKAILKEIDFYEKMKHVYPYKKINITVQIQSVWEQEVLGACV